MKALLQVVYKGSVPESPGMRFPVRIPAAIIRHFYKPQPLCTLDEIWADILAVQKESKGVLDGLLTGGSS